MVTTESPKELLRLIEKEEAAADGVPGYEDLSEGLRERVKSFVAPEVVCQGLTGIKVFLGAF